MITSNTSSLPVTQFDIDFANSAVFVIWTLLDYPRNIDVELGDIPDAIRPLKEVRNAGWLTASS